MNEAYRQDFIRAGAVAKEVRAFGKSLVQKGASYNAIMAQINQKIKELGARPAFPPQNGSKRGGCPFSSYAGRGHYLHGSGC